MAIFYSKGKVSHISEVKSGTSQSGFTWRNLDLIIEVPGSQGSVIKQIFRVNGDRVDDVLRYKVGDSVQVGFILYAREWNGKVFSNVELVNITDETGVKPVSEEKPSKSLRELQDNREEEQTEDGPDLPF